VPKEFESIDGGEFDRADFDGAVFDRH